MKGETVSDNSNANGSTPTILLVDDEEMVLNSIKSFFAIESDYQLAAYTSPTQALQEIEQTHFDLVISDYLMPEMDGITFLAKVKEKRPLIPRILLTGYADKENAIKAINNVGLYQYIEKPWDNEDLQADHPERPGEDDSSQAARGENPRSRTRPARLERRPERHPARFCLKSRTVKCLLRSAAGAARRAEWYPHSVFLRLFLFFLRHLSCNTSARTHRYMGNGTISDESMLIIRVYVSLLG